MEQGQESEHQHGYHRDVFANSHVTLGAAGHWIKTAGILAPLNIGEFVKDHDSAGAISGWRRSVGRWFRKGSMRIVSSARGTSAGSGAGGKAQYRNGTLRDSRAINSGCAGS